jgi:hypothetical protein
MMPKGNPVAISRGVERAVAATDHDAVRLRVAADQTRKLAGIRGRAAQDSRSRARVSIRSFKSAEVQTSHIEAGRQHAFDASWEVVRGDDGTATSETKRNFLAATHLAASPVWLNREQALVL